MRLIAFVGTSLLPADLPPVWQLAERHGVDLDLRPPIVRGNLLSILDTEPPDTRALILDGEFGQRLSVSVTEIREYLTTNRYLAGGSSMGALRAVECRALGMRAHGWVAARYLDRTIQSDDEVALLFDPDTSEPVTIPLVNVRWLAGSLVADGVLPADAAARVFHLARAIHYRNRTPGALERKAHQELHRLAADVLVERLQPEAIPRWDRKRLDALEALEAEIGCRRGIDVR